MKIAIILLAVAVGACGIEVRQKEPLEVNVRHTFELEDIRNYFKRMCVDQIPNGSFEQIDECIETSMDGFMAIMEGK